MSLGPIDRVAATVLAIVADASTRDLLPRVMREDRLLVTSDLAEGLAFAQSAPPDVAFVEIGIGSGAGLAMVHHLKALCPGVTVFALASKDGLEQGAHAVVLGGAALLMLPLGGDEILTALATVKVRMQERAARDQLEALAKAHAEENEWMDQVAQIADCPNRSAAARRALEILIDAGSAESGVVYLALGERAHELARGASIGALEKLPGFGLEPEIMELARVEDLLVLPLATQSVGAGYVLLGKPRVDEPRRRFLNCLAAHAGTALALLGERERAGGGAMKDPGSSAYSFAYYVDVAGREIDRARRYGRRFAIVTVVREDEARDLSATDLADKLLQAARDTDVVARVDEHEMHLLLPESDGLTAHACRRRVLARLAVGSPAPKGILVGVATFPHDGSDLARLLRVARRRAEATRASVVHRLGPETTSLADLLDVLAWDAAATRSNDVASPQPIELDVADAAAFASSVVGDAIRGGPTFIAVATHEHVGLGAAVRASLPRRDDVTFHALEVRSNGGDPIEALSVLAEHGAYALLGRNVGGVVRAMHAADPLLADLLAERLGRAAGLRVFSA
jgi:ActR/RegA family two-component response regulator